MGTPAETGSVIADSSVVGVPASCYRREGTIASKPLAASRLPEIDCSREAASGLASSWQFLSNTSLHSFRFHRGLTGVSGGPG